MNMIYSPEEDSYFLADNVEKYMKKLKDKHIKILDMGSGSGIQAETCIKSGAKEENIVLADIDKETLAYLKKKFKKSKVIRTNLFSNIKEKFDLIIFNPPYLPEDEFDNKKDTTGGKKGNEIIDIFLKDAKNHLKKSGKIMLLTSSLTGKINFLEYEKNIIGKRKLFFEELYVWIISS